MDIMKNKSLFITAGFLVILFCAYGISVAGPGPNAGSVPQGYKCKGPSPVAYLMAGWAANDNDCTYPNVCLGRLEAYVWVGGKLYIKMLDPEYPEFEIIEATVQDLIVHEDIYGDLEGWEFPSEIAEDYGFSGNTRVVVLSEKDVVSSNEELVLENVLGVHDQGVAYNHILRTELKLSFLVPDKNLSY